MPFRPSKWVLYTPVAVLPFLAALVLEGRHLQEDLADRVKSNLDRVGTTWATTAVSGRDVVLSGDAPSEEQMDAAIAAALGTYGVRTLHSLVRIVEPPPDAPVVKPVSGFWGAITIAGTWPERQGNVLTVTLNGQIWTLGQNPELTSDGQGNWALKPSTIIQPGTYDVVATATSPSGLASSDGSKAELTIQVPPLLKAPTVAPLITNLAAPELHGSWDPAVATTLAVTVAARKFRLGTDSALQVSANDWRLTLPEPLSDGTYEVVAEVGDDLGRTAKSISPGQLVIDTVAPANPTIDTVESFQPLRVRGTWPSKDAISLRAILGGEVWEFGTDKELADDGQGKWTLSTDLKLPPGAHDLVVEIADAAGNLSRDVSRDEIAVPEPPPLAAPTVTSLVSNVAAPVLRGTWPATLAEKLTVRVGAAAYSLGTSNELSATGDDWTLKLSTPLADGEHPVTAAVSDALGRTASSASPAILTIDTTPPSAPTITFFNGESPVKLAGIWPEGDAVALKLKLSGQQWALGHDSGLATDGKGNWSFSPGVDLAPGTYDVEVETADRAGNTSRDLTRDEVVIAAPQVLPPPLQNPTVKVARHLVARPAITGTWPELAGASLEVEVAGHAYVLGKNPELSSDGIGNWQLSVPFPLAEGKHDVSARAGDTHGKTVTDATRDEIEVDAQGPAAPTVRLYASLDSPARLGGSWDWANSTSLRVAVPAADIEAELGAGGALTSASGEWQLVLKAPLPPGSYDVMAQSSDREGRIAMDQTRFEILVKDPPPPPPQMTAPTVAPFSSENSPPRISGTWDEAVASALFVSLSGTAIRAALGSDAALTSDGKGNWTLDLGVLLPPGTYDVVVETVDAVGNRIRDLSSGELVVIAPAPRKPTMKRPTVTPYSGEEAPHALTGTWDQAAASSLVVSIEGTGISATLGRSGALTSDGKGNWMLEFSGLLPPGTYEVVVDSTDEEGKHLKDDTSEEIHITPPPPPARTMAPPTVDSYVGRITPELISGTWDEATATALFVSITGTDIRASLGSDPSLQANPSGRWSLIPTSPLPAGTYDVVVETIDAAGNRLTDSTAAEIVIEAPPPVISPEPKTPAPTPQPSEVSYDCEAALSAITARGPVRFAFDRWDLSPPAKEIAEETAALLKDERCLDRKLAATGHADDQGSQSYNLALSKRRAESFIMSLAASGVDMERLEAIGVGEQFPEYPERTKQARGMNRRVVLTMMK